ncbi:Biopterin transporter [Gracilaria domingensis]|nr:Biopterin transporter [Gracilaria domingensis]
MSVHVKGVALYIRNVAVTHEIERYKNGSHANLALTFAPGFPTLSFSGAIFQRSHVRPMLYRPRAKRQRQRQLGAIGTKALRDREVTDMPHGPQVSNGTSIQLPLRKILAGFDPSPELAAILTVYFVQGALGISRLAVSFFMKDTLGLSPAESAALGGAALLPWLIKPLYGFLSDSLPVFGYRRRSYLIAAGVLGATSWLSLSTFVDSAFWTLVATVASSLSVAVSDVVADSIVVEKVRGLSDERSGALQSLCWGTSAVGGLISAYFSGSLLETIGVREIFAITAVLPLLTSLLAGLINENKVPPLSVSTFIPSAKKRSLSLWKALKNPKVYLPIAFIFAWQATPSPESAMFFFTTNELHFGPEFLGRVRLVSSGAALIGLWLYRTYLRDVELKVFFLWATLLSVPLSLTQVVLVTRANVALGISDQLFALSDSAVLTALGQVAFMPTLVLAARMCPPGVEGTLFAAIMSIYNGSGAVSSELGALLTSALGVTDSNFDNLWLLVLLCSFSSLLALPLLQFLDPPAYESSEKGEAFTLQTDESHASDSTVSAESRATTPSTGVDSTENA